jgi:poly(hydroxyalkanoate) depolymerase family esterase
MAVIRAALDGSPSRDRDGDTPETQQKALTNSPVLIERMPAPTAKDTSSTTSSGNHAAHSGFDGHFPRTEKARRSPPRSGTFEDHSFSNAAGRRRYKLYVPSSYKGEATPLIIMLHGCTQSPEDFAAGTRMNGLAEEQTFIVAYPEQSKSANAAKCWNWFNASQQQRGHGEPSLIAGITRQIMRDFAIAPERIYIAGLSAGGAAAAVMGATYPDLYAAVGIHSGLACGAAHDMPSAFAAMQHGRIASSDADQTGPTVPTIVFHGDRDTTVNPVNADHIIAQSGASTLTTKVSRGKSSGGLGYTRTIGIDSAGRIVLEQWVLHGAGHAWSGGSAEGSYTEPRGPDASREMLRFFRQHERAPRS